MRCPERGLYAIADARAVPPARLAHFAAAVLRGGAVLLQYRDKNSSSRQRIRRAGTLLEVCREHGVPLIVNDDPELCLRIGADGVHLGQQDPDLKAAKGLLGDTALLGVSCYADLDRAVEAQGGGADYVAFGGFYLPSSKPRAGHATPRLLRMARQRLTLPIAAIGGLTTANAAPLLTAGAGLLAVIGDLARGSDPQRAAAAYRDLFPPAPADQPLAHR